MTDSSAEFQAEKAQNESNSKASLKNLYKTLRTNGRFLNLKISRGS